MGYCDNCRKQNVKFLLTDFSRVQHLCLSCCSKIKLHKRLNLVCDGCKAVFDTDSEELNQQQLVTKREETALCESCFDKFKIRVEEQRKADEIQRKERLLKNYNTPLKMEMILENMRRIINNQHKMDNGLHELEKEVTEKEMIDKFN